MPRAIARVLLAGGGALAQPPEYRYTQEKRLEDAKAVAEEADIRVLRITMGVTIPRVTLRSTPGYEPLALLGHSTFQVVLRLSAAVSRCYQPRLGGSCPNNICVICEICER